MPAAYQVYEKIWSAADTSIIVINDQAWSTQDEWDIDVPRGYVPKPIPYSRLNRFGPPTSKQKPGTPDFLNEVFHLHTLVPVPMSLWIRISQLSRKILGAEAWEKAITSGAIIDQESNLKSGGTRGIFQRTFEKLPIRKPEINLSLIHI